MGAGAGDLSAAGLGDAEHPLLSAVLPLADQQGWLLTGRISLATHPWLADHAVLDTVLVPAAGLVELALCAGGRLECDSLDELVLEAPLVLPERGAVQLQVTVGAADESGRRQVAIYSRPEAARAEREREPN